MFDEKTVFRQQVVSLPRVHSTHAQASKRFNQENCRQRTFSSQKQSNISDIHNSGNKIFRCNTENPSSSRRERSLINKSLLPSITNPRVKSGFQHPKERSTSGKERLKNLTQNDISVFSEPAIPKINQCFPSSPAERSNRSPLRRNLQSPQKPSTKDINEGLRIINESGIGDSKKIGEGNFGVVYKVSFREAKEDVAVKRVLQDKAFKNREIQIMLELKHPNIVALKHSFFSFVHNSDQSNKESSIISDSKNNNNQDQSRFSEHEQSSQPQQQVYLNIVMEYIPSTLVNIIKFYHRFKPPKDSPPVELFPGILIKLYLYQALRALAYLQGKRIAHRDLKPSNILINHRSHALKLCDFGSAKHISQSERSLSYICSRNYRAPEMLLGSSQYDETVDIWALGCIIVEMIIGEPLFKGQSSLDQLVEIMKVLGTPTPQQIRIMNPDQKILHYPPINKIRLSQVLENFLFEPQILDLLEQMIVYEPYKRIKPLMALMHPIFNELRIEQCRINGKKLPILFDFTIEELATVNDKNAVLSALTPHWYILLKQTHEDKSRPERLYEVTKKQAQQQL